MFNKSAHGEGEINKYMKSALSDPIHSYARAHTHTHAYVILRHRPKPSNN